MTDDDGSQPSERLVMQRLRNRAIEAVDVLARGDVGVRAVGANEWVNRFFDIIDDESPHDWRLWSVLTPHEVDVLRRVHDELVEVCRRTPSVLDDDQFIAEGWPERLAVTAATAQRVLLARGWFDEDIEEREPRHRS
ncbi:hypothetical protein [Motilibacter deserti]|uniref:Uncharacterized protein n=1 Tax=Motilibacter deserti TaxID=2714956 RepID=A0ABX0H2K5_9ACTN|nr:hypothetical protein [Motilibacter deserti]NHC16096.1 hypothetical protein [Motilibacter deserti]